MKKLFLLTCAMLAVGLLFLSPVTAEANGSFGEPTEEACASCHKVAETMLADGGSVPSSEMGTVLGFTMEAPAKQPTLSQDMRTIYAEESFTYVAIYTSYSTGSGKVPI